MVYAHVLIAGDQSLHVTIRFGSRFQSSEEEEQLAPHILDTIVEPSGHLGLLRARLERWSQETGFTVVEIDAVNAGLPMEVSPTEHIQLLEESVAEVATRRDEIQRENEVLRLALQVERECSAHFWEIYDQKVLEAALLEHVGQIAERELKCDHLRLARVKRAEWVQENFH